QYRHTVTPPCGSPGMPRGRTSTAAAQANAVMRRHPDDCSEKRRRLVVRSPHGHEQHARTTDATGREPRVPRSYGRYLVALYNAVRPHAGLAQCPPAIRLKSQLLGSTEGTVASSRPASHDDHWSGPGQGSPKATGQSRREASLRRSDPVGTLAHGGT